MYCRLMEETLSEARGETVRPELTTRVDLRVDAFLPEEYIRDDRQRMEMYRRVAAVQSDADREDILDELIDRFGDTPAVVDSLLDVSQLRYLCSRAGIVHVQHREDKLVMRLDPSYVPDPFLLVQAMQKASPKLTITQGMPASMILKDVRGTDVDALHQGLKVMRRLCEELDRLQNEKKEA